MPLMASVFTSYTPCGTNKKVQTANGTLLTVAGIGTVNLAPIGKLESILHIPKLFINLVSVQKIAPLIPYKIKFNRINALLHDQERELKIGLQEPKRGFTTCRHMRPMSKNIQLTDNSYAGIVSRRITADERRGSSTVY